MASYADIKKRVKGYSDVKQSESKYQKIKKQVNSGYLKFDGVDDDYINSFLKDSDNFIKNTQDQLQGADWNSHSSRYDAWAAQRDNISTRADTIRSYLNANKGRIDEKAYNSLMSYLNEYGKAEGTAFTAWNDVKSYFSQWETEKDYNEAQAAWQDRLEKLDFDLDAGQIELDALKTNFDNYSNVKRERDNQYNYYVDFYQRAGYLPDGTTDVNGDGRVDEKDAALKHKKVVELDSQLAQFGDMSGAESTITQKTQYLNQAKNLQFSEKLKTDALEDADFSVYAKQGAAAEAEYDDWWGMSSEGNIIAAYRGPSGDKQIGRGAASGGNYDDGRYYKLARAMTDEEFNIYNYYFAKYGVDKADEYLNSIEETLNARAAGKVFESLEGNTFLEYIAGFGTGLVGGVEGIKNLFASGDEYIPTSSSQYLTGMIREDLADVGGTLPEELGGGSIGQLGFDFFNTTGNMTPALALGTIPVVGPAAGAITLGASAAGNAFADAIRNGYDKDEARGYAALVGISEAGLQYALGGIGKLGGKATGNFVSKVADKAVSKVNSALGKAFTSGGIKLAGSMVSEFGEEYLQEVLNPVFKNIAFNTNEDVEFFSSDALYAGILGALSAGLLEGAGTVGGEVATYKAGKSVIDAGQVSNLANLGKTFSADTVAYKIASKVDENTDAYTLGQLLREAGADSLSQSNMAEIQKSLVRKGVAEADAQSIAKWLDKAVRGGEFTKSQRAALENNEVISEVYRNVILNQNSTVNQRTQGYQDVLRGLAEEVAGVPAKSETPVAEKAEEVPSNKIVPYSNEFVESRAKEFEEMGIPAEYAKVMALNAPTATNDSSAGQNAVESKFEVSDDGKTINTKSGEYVDVVSISTIKDGEMMLKVKNSEGNVETVNAKDVSFATRDEALLYEMVTRMNVSPQTANALIKGYKADSGISVQTYAMDIPLAYKYGEINHEKGLDKLDLTPEQKYSAFVLGKSDAKANGRTWSNTSRKTPETNRANASEDGIIYDGFELNEDSLTDVQKASLAGVRMLAKTSSALEIHIYESVVEDGKKYAIVNGKKRLAPNGYFRNGNEIYIDINAGRRTRGAMLYTLSHEVVHFMAENSFDDFKALADFLFEHYGNNNVPVEALIQREIDKLKRSYKADKKALPSEEVLYMKAYEEVVAEAMSKMLADPTSYEKLAKLKSENHQLWQKLGEVIKKLLDKVKSWLGIYKDLTPDAMAAHYVDDFTAEVYNQLQDLYLKGFVNAEANYQATIGSRNLEDFADAKNTDGESLFQYKAMEADEDAYRDMLKKWGGMKDSQIDNLFLTIDNAMEIIKDNLEVLDYAWEADIDDRAFSPVKPNSDKLYQVSLDFSTLCRKRILQQTVQAQLQEALNKPLTREEGIAIRDALIALQEEGRQIEVACALCYVESARMKSPEQIKRFMDNKEKVIKEFFAGKSGGSMKEKIKNAETDAREKLHKENPNGIKGKDSSTMLDPRTSSLKALPKKYADEIRAAKKAAKESYVPTAEEQKLIDIAKGMTVSDFTSPEGLENLAKNYRELFDAYTSYVRNATKSKGIEGDTWWRAGDSMQIGDVLIANMNKENGLRSQSWSDFQVVHILDYIAATIELATRNSKEQAYTKVPDYAELMGNTGVMINLSLIPTAKFNGKLEYDSVEGMDYKRSLELRDKYHATVGTICIGIDNVQIKMLLGDITVDYVIPYHKSGMSAAIRKVMHIPTWSQYEEYQSEKKLSRADAEKQAKKYGVKLLAESDTNYQKDTSFSEWFDIKEAQQIAKMENANPSDKAKQKKYGVMYGGYMAMQNAANNYLKLCAERGLSPKFSHEKADFTTEDNYWKLLIDRKMVDNITGEVIEQQTIKPIFDQNEVLRILNDELERYPKVKEDQDYAIRKVTEAYLSGNLKGGMSAKEIAKVMQTPVDNVTTTNVVASAEHNTRLTEADLDEYMKVGKTLHTRNRKKRMLESGKRPILTTPAEIISFMSDVIHGKAGGEVRAFAKVGARLAGEVLRKDSTLDVFGDYLELNADDLRESYKMHSSPKEAGDIPLSDTDFERIPDYLDDFDGVLLTNYYQGKKEVHLYKETDEGYIRILAVSSNERGSLLVTKLIGVSKEKFESKYAKKIERNTGSPWGLTEKSEASNPPTGARLTAGVLSEGIIPQSENPVKVDYDDSDTVYSDDDYAPTFYSKMGKVVEGVKQDKLAANSVVSMLRGKGVKAEEIRWSGIVQFLDGKKSVTKQELLDFINGSMLQIGEQMSGINQEAYDELEALWVQHTGVSLSETFSDDFDLPLTPDNMADEFDNMAREGYDVPFIEDQLRMIDLARQVGNEGRWSKYKLGGGKHYRELVFTMPGSSYSNNAMQAHWGSDAEGILAHARIQDFDVNGKKMLFVEEIQSDWHNAGQKFGYGDNAEAIEQARLKQKELKTEYDSLGKQQDELRSKRFEMDDYDYQTQMRSLVDKETTVLNKLIRANTVVDNYEKGRIQTAPDAPFRNNYHEYVLKRLLRMAAENGYDSIGWTTADVQSNRWSDKYSEGYRIEYDQDMPKFLRKYGGQWGAAVGKTKLRNGTEVWMMPVTDLMKASVLNEGQALFSESSLDSVSNRDLLANALDSVAQNDIERNKLKQYKEKIALLESEQAKLSELRKKANELRFTKGRTAAETKQMRNLEFEANQTANRINTYDRQLFNLEATAALKGVLEREKAFARKKAAQKGKEALAKQREKAAATQRELMTRYQESRKRAVEGRHKTEMRHKIKSVVSELNNLLLHGTKERNVKLGLQPAVASALEAVNMDTVAADERIAKLEVELMKAQTPEKIQEISRKIDNIRNQGDVMASRLEALRRAYADIKASSDNIPEHYRSEASLIADKVDSVMQKVGNTPLRNMNLSQLESVYELYRMVLTTVRNTNTLFRQGKLEDLQQNVSEIMTEVAALPKLKEERLKIGGVVNSFSWNEMIPVYAFERIGSKTLSKFFWETIKGQNTYATDINEANEFAKAAREKFGYDKWDTAKIHEFKLSDGRTFRLTLKHMMSIYAYSKRNQALEHMRKGGFFFNDKETFSKKGGVLSFVKTNEEGYYVDETVLASIVEDMTQEQIHYVDAMQSYLTSMGEKGNEVSRVLWGIDIFKEKIYFPLKSSKDFIFQANQTAQEASLKNDGMTKEVKPGASNPIILEAFDDVWASHVNRMSQYHAFVLPIENLNKIHNYGSWAGTASVSVSTMLAARHGAAVNEYLTDFIKDLNGASSSQGASNPFFSLLSKFKKTAVAASASVVVQQPTAILRAMAVMDSKYFVGKPSMNWNELKKYAPIAIIKEIGGFDAGAGRQAAQWLNTNTLKGTEKVMNKIDEASMKGAAFGDRIGWSAIWDAVKREIKATTNLQVGSEEFLQKAGERFTEVIVLTQVYDSTLSRSGYMRSKHDSVKMLTAFMGEPTVSFNMMYNAAVQAKRGNITKRKATRMLSAVYASVIAASAAASLVYALRDDDEDESYLEKFAEALGGKLLSDINPLNMLPAVRDIFSILDGWEVERTDVAIFQDIKNAFDALSSENKSAWRKIEDFSGAIASLFGLPLKNVLRTGREIYNGINDIFDGIGPSGVGDAFVRGITGEKKNKSEALYNAIVNGDATRLGLYRKDYKDEKSYEIAVRTALRENDSRIHEAAQARKDGDSAKYASIVREIISEGHFSQDIVVGAVNNELTSLNKGGSTSSSSDAEEKDASSIYSSYDINAALEDGDTRQALTIIEDIVKVKTENYINDGEKAKDAETKAKSSVRSSLTSYWKPLYLAAYERRDNAEMARIRNLLYATKLYGSASELVKTAQNWVKDSK